MATQLSPIKSPGARHAWLMYMYCSVSQCSEIKQLAQQWWQSLQTPATAVECLTPQHHHQSKLHHDVQTYIAADD